MTKLDNAGAPNLQRNLCRRHRWFTLILLFSPLGSYAQTLYPFDLPAQPLANSLRAVGSQTSTNVMFEPRLVKDLRAPALRTKATAAQAIRLLLDGTQLNVVQAAPDSILIQDAARDVREAPQQLTSLEEVVVTGTNLRGIAPESSPVVVFTRKDIETSGHTTVEQFLRSVSQNSSAGANQENFNVSLAGADVSEQGASVNLRGLGSRATLVLVNGHRLAPSGFTGSYVDVSLIPISAVERIEILTNGASAIYGSDAVGGVVNFILRKDFSGLETSLHIGTATEGDGDQLALAQAAGWNWDSGRALLTYEYRSEDAVLAADRDFTVGIPPASFFLPQERRHSLYGTFGQQLTERLAVDVSGSYSTRDTERDFIPSDSPLPVLADADSDFYSVAADLTYELPNLWRVQASGSLSSNKARSSQFANEGTVLYNDAAFTNGMGEVGAKIDGDLYDLPGGAVKLAFGVQYRREGHDANYITASQISNGIPATILNVDRSSRAAFAEVLVPVVSPANRIAGIERLELSAAVRHERYSQFGEATDPKFGLLWSPLPGLSVRGTYGTSFRAPLLSETTGMYNAFYFPNNASLYATPGNPLQDVGVALALLGVNGNLGPETSETWTAGIVVRPEQLRGLTFTLDYFSTEFSDRITRPTPTLERLIGNPAFSQIIQESPATEVVSALVEGAAQIGDVSGPGFTNGGSVPADVTVVLDARIANTAITATSGVDLAFDYTFPIGSHEFGLRTSMTYLSSFDDQLTAASATIDALNQPYGPIDLRANAGASWAHAGWGGSLVVNYVDSYEDPRFDPVRPVESFEYVDLNLSYRFGKAAPALLRGTRIALSVLNLFDAAPPALSANPGLVRGVGYDPVNASGRGRFVGLQVRKHWGAAAAGGE